MTYRPAAATPPREELERVVHYMTPRGPDAGGTLVTPDGRVGLGSRRLAIIDPSPAGTQPMWDTRSELAIVFNGEIYNHRELRASLERGGVQFRTGTDTEVLLELYRRDGETMLGLLRGMFALIIWEPGKRRLFVARDAYGIKPLYFADDGSTVRLASEVKALLAGGGVSPEVDPAAAVGFFLTGSVPEPFTMRTSVTAVGPGTSFFVREGAGATDLRQFHSVARAFSGSRAEELVDRGVFVRERVAESVSHHLVSDVPVAIFLSAGIDSSAIAAIASRLAPLHAFTLSFPEFSEAPLAARFARELGMRHTVRNVTREEFLADIPRIFERMDQPTIDGVNTWFISKAVHEAGIKVALSGVGGDELFGGYPSFRNVPRIVRFPRIAATSARTSGHPKASMIARYGRTWGGAWLVQRALFAPEEIAPIIGNEMFEEGSRRLNFVARVNGAVDPETQTSFGRVATLESTFYMRNQLLRDADWASMAHSVELRTPLVDTSLLRQLAPQLLHGNGKEMLGAKLPLYLRDRPKTGFFVPMKEWMSLPADGTSTRMRSWARHVWEAST